MLVFVNALADVILLAIDFVLFGLGEMTIVFRHVALFLVLYVGFPVLKIPGFSWAQRPVLDAIGNSLLLNFFAAIYFVHAGMARINGSRAGA